MIHLFGKRVHNGKNTVFRISEWPGQSIGCINHHNVADTVCLIRIKMRFDHLHDNPVVFRSAPDLPDLFYVRKRISQAGLAQTYLNSLTAHNLIGIIVIVSGFASNQQLFKSLFGISDGNIFFIITYPINRAVIT